MFQPTTECVDSLTIDDVTGQGVPESGTGRTECSVAVGCKPHSRYLQPMCPRWSEPMPATARHVSYADIIYVYMYRVAEKVSCFIIAVSLSTANELEW